MEEQIMENIEDALRNIIFVSIGEQEQTKLAKQHKRNHKK